MARLDDADSLDFPLPALPLDEGVVTRLSPVDARSPAPHPAFDAFFRSLLDGSTDCIEVLRHDGTRRLHQCPRHRTEGNRRLHADARQVVDFALARRRRASGRRMPSMPRSRASTRISKRPVRRARGTVKHWEVTVSPVQDAADGVEWMVSVSRDITPRVRCRALARRRAAGARDARRRARGARAVAEDGGDRQADGRRRARLQQRAAGDRRQSATARAARAATTRRCCARLESAMDAVERGAMLSSQLLAFARRQPLRTGRASMSAGCSRTERRCCAARSARPIESKRVIARRAVEHARRPASARERARSISRSTRATRWTAQAR